MINTRCTRAHSFPEQNHIQHSASYISSALSIKLFLMKQKGELTALCEHRKYATHDLAVCQDSGIARIFIQNIVLKNN